MSAWIPAFAGMTNENFSANERLFLHGTRNRPVFPKSNPVEEEKMQPESRYPIGGEMLPSSIEMEWSRSAGIDVKFREIPCETIEQTGAKE